MNPPPEFTHPLVRALAWLIGSPGLLIAPAGAASDVMVSDAWCARALGDSRQFLRALEASPVELEMAVAASKSRRLGRIAECLVAFWLERSDRFELLARNLAVRDAGRTLGEFDLVFRDRDEDVNVHWEMAVKFYLRRRGGVDFLGPEGRDTLARKAGRIFDHQVGLGATPAGGAVLGGLCGSEVRARTFVKGWLFHPDDHQPESGLVNPRHQRGWWRTLDEFADMAARRESRYSIVERGDWIGGPIDAALCDSLSAGALIECIAGRIESDGHALMIAEFDSRRGDTLESGRGFIVPDQWGHAASG